MLFVGLGVILVLLKWAAWGPVAGWSWWIALAPFGLAAAWWAFADGSGLTRRREIEREDERTKRRREEAADRLGMRPGGRGPRR